MRRRDFVFSAASGLLLPRIARAAVGITSFAKPVQNVANFYNFKGGANLARWAAAYDAVQAGSANAKVLFVGDSETAGYGANGSGYASGARSKSIPAVVGTNVAKTSNSSFFGNQNVNGDGGTMPVYDTRIAMTGGWNSTSGTAGFAAFLYGTTAAGTLSFTPANSIDTIDVWYVTDPSFGSFTVNVDGGSTLATITPTAASSVLKQTISCSLGAHTINIVRASGTVQILGVVASNSAIKEISLYQAGYSSGTSVHWSSSAVVNSNIPVLTQIAPDLTIAMACRNDNAVATGTSTFSTNMQTLITAAKLSGDIILVSSPPANGEDFSAYNTVLSTLSGSNNIPYIDVLALFGSWATANAAGLESDNIHPNGVGYAQIAGYHSRIVGNPRYVSLN